MGILRRGLVGVLTALSCLLASHSGLESAAPEASAGDAKVALQDLKYDDLGKLVRDNKGKVIVVDFWGEY